MRRERVTYSVGYAGALALTGVAFALVHWRFLSPQWTLGVVFGLALIQIIVHFRCFLHITLGRSSRADLQVLLFSSLIVLLMVGGTIVVMLNLRSRMM
jgi:cytochrome o ubiquinol oxidase subunit IV